MNKGICFWCHKEFDTATVYAFSREFCSIKCRDDLSAFLEELSIAYVVQRNMRYLEKWSKGKVKPRGMLNADFSILKKNNILIRRSGTTYEADPDLVRKYLETALQGVRW